jgi:SulP family sulfate permease
MDRLRVSRSTLLSEAVSGLVMALVSIPDAIAKGVLAGVNPVSGVYSMIAGTTVAALFTGSVIMNVDSTSATAIATFDAVGPIPAGQQLPYLVVLGVLVGAFMLALGLLRLGFLVRFISNAVMTGFLSGLGLLTILGQVGDLTGYTSTAPNRPLQALDALLHVRLWNMPTFLVGALTIAAIVVVSRTRLERFAFAIALVLGTLVVSRVAVFNSVAVVGSTTTIPSGLPGLHVPDLSFIPAMILPALALAIIALVQGSGVGQSVPNPDGEYPDPSADFVGQGAANVAVGLVGGVPVGGSLSGTATLRSVGGQLRWSNIFDGLFAALIVLFFAPAIEKLPMPTLAGLLVMVGLSMFNVPRILTVWRTGPTPLALMGITFVATIFLPIQVAVLLGVALHLLLHVFRAAGRVRVERIVRRDDGAYVESEVPAVLSSGEIVVLQPVGSLFFAGAVELEEHLLKPGSARRSVVILRLRNRDEVGSTFIRIIERYGARLKTAGCKLVLAGADPHVMDQLERTGILEALGRENVYPARPRLGGSTERAVDDAQAWIAAGESPADRGRPEKGGQSR